MSQNLDKIIQAAEALSLEEMRLLEDKLLARMEEMEQQQSQPLPERKDRETVQEKQIGSVTYRLQLIKCGKANCKCAKGHGHGPYWYAYWWQGGKTRSKYIGKELKTEDSSHETEDIQDRESQLEA